MKPRILLATVLATATAVSALADYTISSDTSGNVRLSKPGTTLFIR